jgi:hypothetical protein
MDYSPYSNDRSTEAEESPLLEAVSRERLANTADWKGSMYVAPICKVEIADGAVIKCGHESCVKVVNKPNQQSELRP